MNFVLKQNLKNNKILFVYSDHKNNSFVNWICSYPNTAYGKREKYRLDPKKKRNSALPKAKKTTIYIEKSQGIA